MFLPQKGTQFNLKKDQPGWTLPTEFIKKSAIIVLELKLIILWRKSMIR